MAQDLGIMAVTLLLCAFFSGIEIAFFTANKFKIELRNSQGDYIGKTLSSYLKNVPRFLTTTLIGLNIALVLFSISASRVLSTWFEQLLGWKDTLDPNKILFTQTIISTLVILLLGEYLPKILFRRNPDVWLSRLAIVFDAFFRLFSPIVIAIEQLTQAIFKFLLKAPMENRQIVFSKYDLHSYILESLGDDENPEIDPQVFSNALDFNRVRVREFMVPRTEIVALPITATVEELHAKFVETELSRIIIYQRSLDDIKGFVHSQALFRKPEKINDFIQTLPIVPESMLANNLLREFHRKRKRIAIVVDEFGGTAGIVTLEDLVEVVFGDIHDEYDTEADEQHLIEQKINDNTFVFSARLEVEYVNETYDLHLPEGDYTTLSGLVSSVAERIPVAGEIIEVGNYKIIITASQQNKVEMVRVEKIPQMRRE